MAQENEMQRLQQEAVRRVREMQSRAQMAAQPQPGREGPGSGGGHEGRAGGASPAGQGNGGPGGGHEERRGGHEGEGGPRASHGADGALSQPPELLRLLLQEEDRTIILLLLLVLLEENQDPSLLLALLYLAMSPG